MQFMYFLNELTLFFKLICKSSFSLVWNTPVVHSFLDPCSPIRVEDKFRRDDIQGWKRLKKHVIPAPYQVRDKLQRESSIVNNFSKGIQLEFSG